MPDKLILVPSQKPVRRKANREPRRPKNVISPTVNPKIITIKLQGAKFIDFNQCIILLAKMHLLSGKADKFKHSQTDMIEVLHYSVLADFRKISRHGYYISNQDNPKKTPRFFVLSSAVHRLAARDFEKDLEGLAHLDAKLAKYSRVIDPQHYTKLLPETPKIKTNIERLRHYIKDKIEHELIHDIDKRQKLKIAARPNRFLGP